MLMFALGALFAFGVFLIILGVFVHDFIELPQEQAEREKEFWRAQ